jgi:hypothetical protein
MPSRTILVPGTQATTLQDQNHRIVYNPVALGLPLFPKDLGSYPPSEWAALLSMTYAPGSLQPTQTSRLPGTSITKAVMVSAPYQPLLAYDPWPYDWRADIEANGQALLNEVRTRYAAGGSVNLVGHSQGGLLIVAASQLGAPGEFARMVGEVVLVGAPLAGTMRAAEALIFGSNNLGAQYTAVARQMARTWPALYQMLPSFAAVVGPDGHPLPADHQLTSMQGWPAGWNDGITQDMLTRALRMQAMLRHPMKELPADRTIIIMGTNQTTPLTVGRDASGFTKMTSRANAGDTLVPFAATQALDSSTAYQNAILPVGAGTRPHAELCNDPTVSMLITKLVRSAPVQAAKPAPTHA